MDGMSASHWTDVSAIVGLAADDAGHELRLVSEASYSGVILKNIVSNLYNDPIVICDVSGRNPNVMFELGLRLAFDKPTIIIKDDKTPYSFDTSPIKHIPYPRDLRYPKMVEFQTLLCAAIHETVAEAEKSATYSTFLKHFGEFKVAHLEQKEVSAERYISEQINELRGLITDLSAKLPRPTRTNAVLTVSSGDTHSKQFEHMVFNTANRGSAIEFANWLMTVAAGEVSLEEPPSGQPGTITLRFIRNAGALSLASLFREFNLRHQSG